MLQPSCTLGAERMHGTIGVLAPHILAYSVTYTIATAHTLKGSWLQVVFVTEKTLRKNINFTAWTHAVSGVATLAQVSHLAHGI